MTLGRDVSDERLDLLIAAGVPLDEKMIERLEALNVDDVYVHEEGTDDVDPAEMVSDLTRRKTHKVLRRAFDDLQNLGEMTDWANEDVASIIQFDDRYEKSIAVQDFREVIHCTIEDMFLQREAVFETPMVKQYLNRNYEHSLNTSILSIMIGRYFGFSSDELIALGTAATLHDMGKLVIPKIKDLKMRDMSPEEMRMYKKHPIVGAAILEKAAPDCGREIASIKQHHEQQDGRGYPIKMRGYNDSPLKVRVSKPNGIFRFAEVIAVANAFDNLLNGELQADPMTPERAVETLVRGAGQLYNRTVVSAAAEIINTYPVGSIVEIRSGDGYILPRMRAVVRKGTSARVHHPVIVILWDSSGKKIPPIEIDLNKRLGIKIEIV
jgi:HD-GYP domain-containing protein (c-di-GMP phosphodiesterase class II)